MIRKVLFLSVFLIMTQACDSDKKDQIIDNFVDDFVLIAGEAVHDSVIHSDFDPFIKVLGQRYGNDSVYYYKDSVAIDLNFDAITDLRFDYFQEFEGPVSESNMTPGFSSCVVETETNIEIACTYFDDILQPERLNFGDTISTNLLWKKADNGLLFATWGMDNDWYVTNYNSYMGFRMLEQSDTLYGWIRLNTKVAYLIEIYDYVIEKNTSH